MPTCATENLPRSQCWAALRLHVADAKGVYPQMFSLHIGADLKLPTGDALHYSRFQPAPAPAEPTTIPDPFEYLPFRRLAEFLGDALNPVVEAVRFQPVATATPPPLHASMCLRPCLSCGG